MDSFEFNRKNAIIFLVCRITRLSPSSSGSNQWWLMGEWGNMMHGDLTTSSILRKEILNLRWLCQHFSFLFSLSPFLSTNSRIHVKATFMVSSFMLAMQTLNHPASEQRKEEPGETLSLTSLIMTRHRAVSASTVLSLRNPLKSIHNKRPAFAQTACHLL